MAQGGVSERGIKVRRGLESLRELDFTGAGKEFSELAKRYPANQAYQASLRITEKMSKEARDLDRLTRTYLESRRAWRPPPQDPSGNGSHSDLPELCLRSCAYAVAKRAERERGASGEAGGVPLARLFVEAGEAARARACAEAALRERGESAPLLACLANAYSLDEQNRFLAEARDLYRRAFVLDPHAVDFESIVDGAVRDLVSLAELEYEVPGDPLEWLPTVGFLERVLPIAHIDEAEVASKGIEGLMEAPVTPEDSRSFYHYLRVTESCHNFGVRGEAIRIEARKRLKAIAPQLYAKYLKRF
jgi:hypothetical protein